MEDKSTNTPIKFHVSLMDKYILGELITPFLFGIGLFTALGISIGTLFELIRRVTESGLFVGVAIQIFLLRIPEFIVLAFPMSLLLATLIAYSRLSGDSEIIALRSVGVSLFRLVIPALVLSLSITGITFFINDVVTPSSNRQATITLQTALNQVQPQLSQRNILYPEYADIVKSDGSVNYGLARLFYAEEFNGNQMKYLTILDFSRDGINQVLTAETAQWNIRDNIWDFFNGTIYIVATDGSSRNVVRFEHQQLTLPRAPLDFANRPLSYQEMSISQAQEYLETAKLEGNRNEARTLAVKIQSKIALPFVCVVFAIMGSALGIRPQNTGKAKSFGICIAIILAYYILSFMGESLAISGILNPFMGAWLGNIIGFTLGSWLLYINIK
ncbi:LptF/LptG family permease [Cyanobacterium stanieri LEGE 03274]|uniref:LptF/LptG family permease n=1 Tax=Cyanobacterium stanieri LEGE 03274 TaxID=1828756 RepID=A0ABR9V4M2_9CHRO|nr:LptF/LptG family permease [Cyanobacterium stanieri]MBE9222496.1 LptF/LptG family permease [Cyanobacterium stanieri LEGE 03274]